MKLKFVTLLIISTLSTSYVQAKNYDVTSDNILLFNQINERFFLTNTSSAPANITMSNGLTVNSEGSFHVGFSGKTDTNTPSVAKGDINMNINGNFQIYNDTWIGKFDTKFFTQYLGLHRDYPYEPINYDINVHVIGDINVELGEDKKRGGLMILAGNVMGTGANTTGKTTVKVDRDTNIRSGDNHLAGTALAPAKLTTRSFNLTGGDIEIIGAKTVLETTNNDNNRSSVMIGRTGKMIIMRGGTVDVSNGGNFDVIEHGILSASRGNGFVKLASDGQLNISKNATIESSKGSLFIGDQTNKTTQLNIEGIVSFGISDSLQINNIRGDNVNIKSSARYIATDDFIKNGLKYTTTEANTPVLSANNSLKIVNIKDNETKSLIRNIYGDLNFKLAGNELKFVNASNVTDFTNEKHTKAAADRQISRYYQQVGTGAKNIAKRFAQNLAKVSYESFYNTTNNKNIISDKSLAGDLNWEILSAIGRGNLTVENRGTAMQFNRSLAGIYNNNHGLHLTEIALNSFNYTKSTLDNRILQFYQTEKSANNDDNLWINITHHYENIDNHRDISGYKYSSNGFIIGYDREVIDNLLVGSAIGYESGNYKDKAMLANDSDTKNYQIQLYSNYKWPINIFTSAYVGYSYGKNRLKGNDQYNTIKENFHSNTWSVGATVGYQWQDIEQLTLIPTIGLTYVYTENSAHNVIYNNIDLVKYGKASNSALLIPIDLMANYLLWQDEDSQLLLRTQIGYAFNLSDDEFDSDITINGINGLSKMSAYSSNRTKNQYNIGGGLTYKYNLVDINIDYQYVGENKRNSNYISALAKINF